EIDQASDGLRRAAGRDLRRDAAERRAVVVDAAADHDEVLRHGAIAELADAALKADRGDVMLAAADGATADIAVAGPGRGCDVRMLAQVLAEQVPEAARLGHRDAAGFRAGAAEDVRNRAETRVVEACRRQRAVELVQPIGRHPAEDEILLDGD